MTVDPHIYIALVAAMINVVLSLIVPVFVSKDSKIPFVAQVRKNYSCNRDVILVSSILVVVFVYVSLKITPFIETNVFNKLSQLNTNIQLIKQ